jgi:glycolate oxidase iron-sulfur subunit
MATPFEPQNTPENLAHLADSCVQCGLCLPHCPTYQLDCSEAESPRGRIAYMKALATQYIAPTDTGDAHLDHCLGCRRCENVCPANVPYGQILSLARAQQFLRKPPSLPVKLSHALLDKPRLLSLAAGLARWNGRLPALPKCIGKKIPPISDKQKKLALFVGCIANSYEANTRLHLQYLLASCGFSVEILEGQTCCGTAALHLGDTETVNILAEKNRRAFAQGMDVLSLASGCHEQLARSLAPHNKVMDALDFLYSQREFLQFKPANKRIALHIPCSQSNVVKSNQALLALLKRVPDLQIDELPDHGCCGAAGLHMLAEPKRAADLRAPLMKQIAQTEATELLSSNIGCRLHIANALTIPVRHPIDFLAEHLA